MVGFVCVLCIGNYYRAKKALERQKQRRLARLANSNGGGLGMNGVVVDSPKSSTTSGSDMETERQHLLAAAQPSRRRNNNNNNNDMMSDNESLLFKVDDRQAANLLGV